MIFFTTEKYAYEVKCVICSSEVIWTLLLQFLFFDKALVKVMASIWNNEVWL